jgi:serpin B
MHMAFSVLYEGVRGETAGQLRDVFGMIEDDAARHHAVSDTMSSLNRDDPHATLEMANSLWLAERLVPHALYVEVVRDTYEADMETVDFGDNIVTTDLINGWAAEKTRDKIPKVLKPDDVDDSTLAAILNAIYFKGAWEVPFDPDDTRPGDFDTGNGTVQADMMHMVAPFDYAEYDGTQILRMPYVGDRLSMLVVLPPSRDGMIPLEESLTAEVFEEWRQGMHGTDIAVFIPKFEAKTHYDLIPKLEDLGITLIFSGGNFSGISDTGMFVDKAVQDAYVKVNEEGTEAAAVTTIILGESEPPKFIADRPFLFFIQDDESGTILFMGKITDPTS